MTYELNSYKTFKDNWILVICGMIIALFGMLLPMTRWASYSEEEKAEEITEIESEREPWTLTASWDSQLMPEIEAKTSHDRFKELSWKYWINPSTIWEVENKYNIRESVVLCLIIAETSGWKSWYWKDGCWNFGNVGNNDRWDRRCYSSEYEWLAAVGRALSNRYLWKIQTLWCLSNAWSCTWWEDFNSRFATSNGNWERTMLNCLNTVYEEELWPIDPSRFNVRRVFTIYQ